MPSDDPIILNPPKAQAKPVSQSKTIWFGGALIVAGAVVTYLDANSGMLAPYFGKWGGLATAAIGVANVLLRLATTRPIGK